MSIPSSDPGTNKPQCSSFLGVSSLPDGSCIWPSPSGAGPSTPVDAVMNITSLVGNKQFWIRVALFIIGVITLIAGLHAFTGISATV